MSIMRMRAFVLLLVGPLTVVSPTLALELSPAQERFLNEEAIYIITSGERERFLELPSAEEREAFIANFWQVRDPIPETAVNEFKEEHFERIRYVNEKFRESRAGWRTARGQMYITLGPPNDIMHYPSNQDLYPLEIWFYYNLDIPQFPSALQFIFFRRNGVGEYRLFSPAFDGMKELIADRVTRGLIGPLGQVPFSVRQRWDIDIVKAAESVATGENLLSSEVVLAEVRTPGFVFEKTRRNLMAQVTAEASFGRELPVDFELGYFRGRDDFTDVQLSVEVAPDNVHVNQYDKKMLGRFDVIGTFRLLDSDEALEEFRDTLEISIQEDTWEVAQHYPVLFETKVPLLPGRYRLELFVRDFVGRQLGIVNRVVSVPEFPTDRLSVSSFLAAFKADEAEPSETPLPHQFGRLRLFPKPNHVFGHTDRVLSFFEVYYPEELFDGQAGEPEVSVRYVLKRGEELVLDETSRYRPDAGSSSAVDVLKVISSELLTEGEYTLEAFLTEPKTSFQDFASLSFTVAGPQPMGRLSTVGLQPEVRAAERYYRDAHHYLAAGRYQDAVRRFQVALDYEPYFNGARRGKARAEILSGDPELGERTAREVLERDPADVEALALVGLALFQQGEFSEAAEVYGKALEVGGEATSLLNALGETQYAAGNVAGAVSALSRSLDLDPEQPVAREFLDEVKAGQGAESKPR